MKTLELVRKAYELDLEGVHILDKYSITSRKARESLNPPP